MDGIFPRHARHVVREMRALSAPERAKLARLCRRLRLRRGAERARKETGNDATPHPLRLARAL